VFGIVAFVAVLFTVKFHLAREKVLRNLYNSPSVVFMGANSDQAARHIAGNETVHHRGMHISSFEGKKLIVHAHHRHSGELRKMKGLKSFVYMFDVSPSAAMKKQLREYRKYQKMFSGTNFIKVAGSSGDMDMRKIQALRKELGNVHQVSISSGSGMDKLKNHVYSALRKK
jgi:hypothetical protein